MRSLTIFGAAIDIKRFVVVAIKYTIEKLEKAENYIDLS